MQKSFISRTRSNHYSMIANQLRYRFDNFMSKGTVALVSGLASVSLVFIVLMAVLVNLSGITPEGSDRLSLPEAIWGVLMRTLDSGTVGGDTGWVFRLTMLFVTFGGIFVVSTLIGVLSSGIDAKLEDLRKGRSRVIETDHIVILGWSLQIFTLISELALANANRVDTCIVILSDTDKVEMETALSDMLGKLPRIRLVCRTGNPSNIADLGIVNIQSARSIIILNPTSDHADTQLIKTLLAITTIPRSQPYHIVAQVQTPKTLDVIRLIGQEQIEPLLTHDLISRIVVQTCRQSGLSVVYMELLNFSGDEIYFREEPALCGKTYGQALSAYNDSTVIGLQRTDGTIQLNPSSDTVLQTKEALIVISEDDDTIHVANPGDRFIDHDAIQTTNPASARAEHTLILGWSDRVCTILQLLDQYVAPGSKAVVVAEFPVDEVDISEKTLNLQNQTLGYTQGDPTDRAVLDALNLNQFEHAIVLCNPTLDPEQADAQTLVTLLHLRDICDRQHHDCQVVTEILNVQNQALAQIARPDDFVISEQIISLMLAQVAEQKSINAVLTDLFNPDGSEIYLKPVTSYVTLDRPVNFYTVVEAARQRGESAIGYRHTADANNVAKSYGVVINPSKDQLIEFKLHDAIIVLAEA